MKKILLVAMIATTMTTSAFAASKDVIINGGSGSTQISQCASAVSCNDAEMDITINGGIKGDLTINGDVSLSGKEIVIKGKDGLNGKDGKDGLNGTNGLNGKDGTNGLDGKDGLNGANGLDGKDGTNGLDGAKGDRGEQGLAGTNGLDGLNGKDADMTKVNANTEATKSNATGLSALAQSTNQRFANLQRQVDDNRDHASAGIAGAAAMANIPQVSQNSKFSLGAGIGGYDGESALAVGVSARFNTNIVTKASVAMTSQDAPVYGAGVSYEW